MNFNQKLSRCLIAQIHSESLKSGGAGGMWSGRGIALVSVALAHRRDLSEESVESIAKVFTMESLAERARAGGEGGRACSVYLHGLPGFPSMGFTQGENAKEIPESTRDNHGYVQMQIATGGILSSICASIKDVSARWLVADSFYDQCAEDLEGARKVFGQADEIESVCKRPGAEAKSQRL